MYRAYLTKDELINTPSRKDGVSEKEENRCRHLTTTFMLEVGISLKLPQLTISTAMVYLHRFYARRSLAQWDRFIVGTTCLFLAGKVEETTKRLKDFILYYMKVKHKQENKEVPPLTEEAQLEIKEKILTCEAELLRVIGFDLEVQHPYICVREYCKTLVPKNKLLMRITQNFVNDSLQTRVSIQYPPKLVALASIYLAARYLKFALPTAAELGVSSKQLWFEVLEPNVLVEDIHEVANQILDLYDMHDGKGAVTQSQSSSGISSTSVDGPSSTSSSSSSLSSTNHSYSASSSSQNQSMSSSLSKTSVSSSFSSSSSSPSLSVSGSSMSNTGIGISEVMSSKSYPSSSLISGISLPKNSASASLQSLQPVSTLNV